MDEILLSVCMPTYKRKEIFMKAYKSITEQIVNLNIKEKVEYIISVNPSDDGTESFLEHLEYEFVKVNINSKNIGADNNIALALSMASGKYVWLIGDDDILCPTAIQTAIDIIQKHKDVSWIYMNYGYEDKSKTYLYPMYLVEQIKGYHPDGREAILSYFKYLDGGILFTSANIYLREGMRILKEKGIEGPLRPMLYTIYSASIGGAYIVSEPMVNQGQEILWKDQAFEIVIKTFNLVLLELIGNGFSKREIMKMIRERMTHEAVSIWFVLLKEFFLKPFVALKHYLWYWKMIPFTTLCMTVSLPFWGFYLFFRHKKRNRIRQQQKQVLFTNNM